MNLKDELGILKAMFFLRLKEKNPGYFEKYNDDFDLENDNVSESDVHLEKDNVDYDVFDKNIVDFLDWFSREYGYTSSVLVEHFIYKMSSWYEMRYSEKDLVKNFGRINPKWSENVSLLNMDFFISTLSNREHALLKRPSYSHCIRTDINGNTIYFDLSKKGTILKFDAIACDLSKDDNRLLLGLVGMNLKDAYEKIRSKCINNDLFFYIERYERALKLKKGILNAVMYMLMFKKTNAGLARALLFAKEFNLDINIPLKYGIHRSGDINLIYEYLASGGTKDLECYFDYLTGEKDDIVTIADILKSREDFYYGYSMEDSELHQRLVDVLQTRANQIYDLKEEVKKLRLERNLARSRSRK